jgi:hypothetical protein
MDFIYGFYAKTNITVTAVAKALEMKIQKYMATLHLCMASREHYWSFYEEWLN